PRNSRSPARTASRKKTRAWNNGCAAFPTTPASCCVTSSNTRHSSGCASRCATRPCPPNPRARSGNRQAPRRGRGVHPRDRNSAMREASDHRLGSIIQALLFQVRSLLALGLLALVPALALAQQATDQPALTAFVDRSDVSINEVITLTI